MRPCSCASPSLRMSLRYAENMKPTPSAMMAWARSTISELISAANRSDPTPSVTPPKATMLRSQNLSASGPPSTYMTIDITPTTSERSPMKLLATEASTSGLYSVNTMTIWS